MQTGKEKSMSEKTFGRFQASVVFNDVAIYFSEEEWKLLKQWQKDLYTNVMKEIHGALISLGYTIVNPDVLVRVSKGEEPCLGKHHDSERRKCRSPFSSCSDLKPDILIRIKESEISSSSDQQNFEEREIINPDITDCIDDSAEYSSEHKHEEKTNRNNHDMKETGSIDSPKIIGEQPATTFVFPLSIKQEEEPHPIAHEDSKKREDTSSPCTSYPVFNPELSLWIKEEDDSQYPEHPDSEGRESVNSLNSVEISTKNFLHHSKKPRICAAQDGPKWKDRSPTSDRLDEPSACSRAIKKSKHSHVLQRPHKGERLFQCSKCEKRFTRNSNLIAHQRTHTGERPHKCTECEWSFSHSSNLFRHQRIHAREQNKYLIVSQILGYTNEMNCIEYPLT
ncbi:zinc finger protein 282-like isoform X3 [Rhinatrema bivittatum]|uniref:zinc finger protein 282-like isoform X3 n=1 Tax=Rhinatrema bivittatum TaxID=194408 RepID=UPI00112D3EF8|nr:zinc finger protein 282-like isoform X3 [Rhinatrema bivittatum]